MNSNVLLPEDWNTGAAVIAQRVSQATGEKLAFLLVYTAYDSLPQQARLWQRALASKCEQSDLTVEDYEQAIDDSEDWHLSYPDLPDGEYLFYFTPKGRDLYLGSMIHIEGLAASIYAKGSFEVVQIPYRQGAVYEDDLQVAYLKD